MQRQFFKVKKIFPFLLLALILTSCHGQKEVAYMQDAVLNQEEVIGNVNNIRIRPEDKLTISVTCKEPQIAQLLNPIESNRNVTQGSGKGTSSNGRTIPYTVDSDGNIDFPLLGKIHIEGLTRLQVAEKIKKLIISENIVSDPTVYVEFNNLHYSVLGEVNSPGNYAISDDHLTLLDALAQAGDLTIFGRRDKVYVIRETAGKRTKHVVDLRSQELFNSPVYYLQQNDVVYVEPNGTRAGQASVNENNWKSVGLWMSVASLLMSAAVLIFK